eukprot:jgi/Tetstr1/430259/TSEL_020087.t1
MAALLNLTRASSALAPYVRAPASASCTGTAWSRRWLSGGAPTPELEVSLLPLDKPDEHIFSLTFNRPASRNAIGRKFLAELREALANMRRERTARCLLVSSAVPSVFCAGADLK